jgi:hypothetical protein
MSVQNEECDFSFKSFRAQGYLFFNINAKLATVEKNYLKMIFYTVLYN